MTSISLNYMWHNLATINRNIVLPQEDSFALNDSFLTSLDYQASFQQMLPLLQASSANQFCRYFTHAQNRSTQERLDQLFSHSFVKKLGETIAKLEDYPPLKNVFLEYVTLNLISEYRTSTLFDLDLDFSKPTSFKTADLYTQSYSSPKQKLSPFFNLKSFGGYDRINAVHLCRVVEYVNEHTVMELARQYESNKNSLHSIFFCLADSLWGDDLDMMHPKLQCYFSTKEYAQLFQKSVLDPTVFHLFNTFENSLDTTEMFSYTLFELSSFFIDQKEINLRLPILDQFNFTDTHVNLYKPLLYSLYSILSDYSLSEAITLPEHISPHFPKGLYFWEQQRKNMDRLIYALFKPDVKELLESQHTEEKIASIFNFIGFYNGKYYSEDQVKEVVGCGTNLLRKYAVHPHLDSLICASCSDKVWIYEQARGRLEMLHHPRMENILNLRADSVERILHTDGFEQQRCDFNMCTSKMYGSEPNLSLKEREILGMQLLLEGICEQSVGDESEQRISQTIERVLSLSL